MIKLVPRNILRIMVLVFAQVFILNNIQFSGLINPYFYVLFILLLPFETPGWLLLTLGFALGLIIDLFANTPGIHASATVFMAFLRPLTLNILSPRNGYVTGSFPRAHYYGFKWFFIYTSILVFAHHIFLFYVEIFRFADFFITLQRAILSSVFTILMIVTSQFFIYRK